MAPHSAPVLTRISGLISHFRWLFMPLGMLALIAVGVHAAADTVDDRFLWLVHRFDAWLDGHFARVEFLHAWVDRFGSGEQTLVARSLTLLWELSADLVLAVPILGYRETSPGPFTKKTWRTVIKHLSRPPTPMRVVRPVVTAIFALAGAYSIARLIDGALFVSLRDSIVPALIARPFGRMIALVAFVHLSIAFGWRAVVRAMQHAEAASSPPSALATASEPKARLADSPWTVGLIGSAITGPLALAALLDALPLSALFR